MKNYLNASLTILTVSIASASLFFAMFQQFELMLLSMSFAFILSLLIKQN